jgi:hypothetical protein
MVDNDRVKQETITTDLEQEITMDCPTCKSGTIKLSAIYDPELGTEWRGVTCDNLLCESSFTMRKEPEVNPLKKKSP